MRILKYTTLAAVLLMGACQSGEKTPKTETSGPTAEFSLRATSDIQTPAPIKAATFVPNSVASWLGHIILLDNTGTLHRATTGSAETDVVALGKYTDVIGLAREKKSGVFLALTPQGQIKAFVQSDDEGNYSPLAVSQGDVNIERFCHSAQPSEGSIWGETITGKAVNLTTEIFEDASLTLTQAETEIDKSNPCEAKEVLKLSPNYTLKPDSDSSRLTLSAEGEDISVEITNGLSIGGINQAGFVTVTSTNMGSVFNEGVLLVADEDEGRLVLISRGYALKELGAR